MLPASTPLVALELDFFPLLPLLAHGCDEFDERRLLVGLRTKKQKNRQKPTETRCYVEYTTEDS